MASLAKFITMCAISGALAASAFAMQGQAPSNPQAANNNPAHPGASTQAAAANTQAKEQRPRVDARGYVIGKHVMDGDYDCTQRKYDLTFGTERLVMTIKDKLAFNRSCGRLVGEITHEPAIK